MNKTGNVHINITFGRVRVITVAVESSKQYIFYVSVTLITQRRIQLPSVASPAIP
jgi:hypothetical protein